MQEELKEKSRIIRDTTAAIVGDSKKVRDIIMTAIEEWLAQAYDWQKQEGTVRVGDMVIDFGLPNVPSIDTFLIQQLRELIFNALQESGGFDSSLARFLQASTQIDRINASIHQSINDIEVDEDILNPVRRALTQTIVNALNPSNVTSWVSQNILPVLSKSLALGRSMRDTQQAIEERIGSSLRRYAVLYTRDGLYGYDGAVNDVIKQQYGLNAYRYVGSLVKASRAHCKRWVTREILDRQYLEREIAALHLAGDPDGFRPETTWDNFGQYRGGYNCRHQAIPIRINNTLINYD